MTAATHVAADVVDLLREILADSDNGTAYVKARHLAPHTQHSAREIGKVLAAIRQDKLESDGLVVEQWSSGSGGGSGYTWKVKGDGSDSGGTS